MPEKLKKPKRHLPKVLEEEEIQALFASIPIKSYSAARNRAAFSLMLHSGLRVSEACDLKPGSLNWKKREIRVIGKGDKERVVPIYNESTADLENWKRKRPKGVDWFFCTHKGKRLSREYLYQALKRYAKRAENRAEDPSALPNLIKIHPHMLRHTCGTVKLRQFKGNLRKVQKLLGHEKVETTAIYTHLDVDDLRLEEEDLKLDDPALKQGVLGKSLEDLIAEAVKKAIGKGKKREKNK